MKWIYQMVLCWILPKRRNIMCICIDRIWNENENCVHKLNEYVCGNWQALSATKSDSERDRERLWARANTSENKHIQSQTTCNASTWWWSSSSLSSSALQSAHTHTHWHYVWSGWLIKFVCSWIFAPLLVLLSLARWFALLLALHFSVVRAKRFEFCSHQHR